MSGLGQKPLAGCSILLVDDDVLAAFRLRQALVAAGARVVMGDARDTLAYLDAAALAAVVVSASVNSCDLEPFVAALASCPAPWVAYGVCDHDRARFPTASASLALGAGGLVDTLAILCGLNGSECAAVAGP